MTREPTTLTEGDLTQAIADVEELRSSLDNLRRAIERAGLLTIGTLEQASTLMLTARDISDIAHAIDRDMQTRLRQEIQAEALVPRVANRMTNISPRR